MKSEALACRIGVGLSTSQSVWEVTTVAARAARGGGRGQKAVDLAFLWGRVNCIDLARTTYYGPF